MSKPFDIRDHFRVIPGETAAQDDYLLSMAATIWMAYDCIFDMQHTSPEGRASARLLVSACVELFKAKRLPKAGYLETWLLQGGADRASLLPTLAEACETVGDLAVAQVIRHIMEGAAL